MSETEKRMILELLRKSGPLRRDKIFLQCNLSRTPTYEMLVEMESAGLVIRELDPADLLEHSETRITETSNSRSSRTVTHARQGRQSVLWIAVFTAEEVQATLDEYDAYLAEYMNLVRKKKVAFPDQEWEFVVYALWDTWRRATSKYARTHYEPCQQHPETKQIWRPNGGFGYWQCPEPVHYGSCSGA